MEDDEIRLPSDTLKILEEFLKEKQEREAKEAEQSDNIEQFEENWVGNGNPIQILEDPESQLLMKLKFQQLSQFWYDDETKNTLATLCKRIIEEEKWDLATTRIGLLSCPSAFASVKAIGAETYIFEYDERFSNFGASFVHYDYNTAFEEGVLDKYQGFFDIIIADPPFLAEECIEKLSKIVKRFSKKRTKVVLCSGLVVQEWSQKFLNLELCKWEPMHQRNLGNQFASYANFDLDRILTT